MKKFCFIALLATFTCAQINTQNEIIYEGDNVSFSVLLTGDAELDKLLKYRFIHGCDFWAHNDAIEAQMEQRRLSALKDLDIKKYILDMAELRNKDIQDDEMPNGLWCDQEFISQYGNFIQIRNRISTSGANVVTDDEYIVYDLGKSKRLSLSDLIDDFSKSALHHEVEKAIRNILHTEYDMSENEIFDFFSPDKKDEILANLAFYFADNGFVLVLPPYTFPAVRHSSEIDIPYDNLRGIIKDEFLK